MHLEADVLLAPMTTLGIGGPAQWFCEAKTPDAVAEALAWARERDASVTVLGGGSNVVIADAGVEGLVLRIGIRGLAFAARGARTIVSAGAGERWDDVVHAVVERGLAGVECLSGIPGTVGGTPIQNVGAYGQEVGHVISAVTVMDRVEGRVRLLTADECGFAYRASRFKLKDQGRFVVLGVELALSPGRGSVTYPDVTAWCAERGVADPTVGDIRQAVLAIRASKGMVLNASDRDTASVGSFFTNPVLEEREVARLKGRLGVTVPAYPTGRRLLKVPAAWLLEQAGCGRGFGTGPARLSSKHALAITNVGGARARDVVALACVIKRAVEERCGVSLVPEPVFLGFGADPDVAYLMRNTEQHVDTGH